MRACKHSPLIFALSVLLSSALMGIGGCPTTYYRDADGDGFGDPNDVVQSSSGPPTGYVVDDTDCDEQSATAAHTYPGAAWWDSTTACMKDADGDGFGDSAASSGVTAGLDCNDADPDLSPFAIEVVGDGIDNNCNGKVDEKYKPLTRVPLSAGGGYHSLALDGQGRDWTWGNNTNGQLGDMTVVSSSTPVQMAYQTGVPGIVPGHGQGLLAGGAIHAAAMGSGLTVTSSGNDDYGQLGVGKPTLYPGLSLFP